MLINETHGSCLAPPSNFTQSVRLELRSYDVDDTVVTNFDHYYEFVPDFELHKLDPDFIMLPDHPSIVNIIGTNFNRSHSYTLVMKDFEQDISIKDSSFPCKYINDIQLQVDLKGIETVRSRKYLVYLSVEGNDQLNKYYASYLYLVMNPIIRTIGDPVIDRDTLTLNYISVQGSNVIITDKALSCIWSLNTTLTQDIVETASNILSTDHMKNGSHSVIDCIVPNSLIKSGGNVPTVTL